MCRGYTQNSKRYSERRHLGEHCSVIITAIRGSIIHCVYCNLNVKKNYCAATFTKAGWVGKSSVGEIFQCLTMNNSTANLI